MTQDWKQYFQVVCESVSIFAETLMEEHHKNGDTARYNIAQRMRADYEKLGDRLLEDNITLTPQDYRALLIGMTICRSIIDDKQKRYQQALEVYDMIMPVLKESVEGRELDFWENKDNTGMMKELARITKNFSHPNI